MILPEESEEVIRLLPNHYILSDRIIWENNEKLQ